MIINGVEIKDYELDWIFCSVNSIPNIAGLYIGKTIDDSFDGYDYISDHLYGFSELINKIDYSSFSDFDAIAGIEITMPTSPKHAKEQAEILKDYLSNKYYHTKLDESIEYDYNRDIAELYILISNDYYQFEISLSEDGRNLVVNLSAVEDEYEIYNAFNSFSFHPEMLDFFKKSTYLCPRKGDDRLCLLLPFDFGVPSIEDVSIGSDVNHANLTFELLNERRTEDPIVNRLIDDYNLSFDYEGENDYCDFVGTMIIQFRLDKEWIDELFDFINYLRCVFLIESADYSIEEDEEYKVKNIKVNFQNRYYHISIENKSLSSQTVEITIEKNNEVSYEVYRALSLFSRNYKYYSFLNEMIMTKV